MHYRFFDGRTQLCEPFFCLPASEDPADCLPSRLRPKRDDDARYLVSLVMWKAAIGKTDQRGRVPLKYDYLGKVMAEVDAKAVIDALLCAGVLHRDHYTVGTKSYAYWLDSRFDHDSHVIKPVECRRLKRALHRLSVAREAELQQRRLPIHDDLEKMQLSLSVDEDEYRDIASKIPVTCGQAGLMGTLISGRYFFAIGQYLRVTNSITSLKRELRCSLRLDGQELGTVDIRNSQPALLAKTLEERRTGRKENRERKRTGETSIYEPGNEVAKSHSENGRSKFTRLCQEGKFYCYIAEKTGLSRDYVKERVLTDFLAKAKANKHGDEYPSEVEDFIRDEFPDEYWEVRATNRDGWEHANQIRELQIVESKLVIEGVAQTLRQRSPDLKFLTLHDAIFCPVDRIDEVQSAFDETFRQNGFPMATEATTDLRKAYLETPRDRTKKRRRRRTKTKGVAA